MHPRKTSLLGLTALAASCASVALADTVRAVDDGRGDAKCASKRCLDLKNAVAGTGLFNKSEVLYTITQHDAVQRSRLPRIAINAAGAGTSAPEYYVERKGSRTGVFDANTGKRTGAAALDTSGGTAVRWSFLPSAIGDPGSFGWRVEIVAGAEKIDATPNSGYRARSLR
jgi:hypothetical protein